MSRTRTRRMEQLLVILAVDKEYEQRLEKTGVTWDVLDDRQKSMYVLLLQIRKRDKLGIWLIDQRDYRKTGKRRKDQQNLLEKAGIFWIIDEIQKNLRCTVDLGNVKMAAVGGEGTECWIQLIESELRIQVLNGMTLMGYLRTPRPT